VAGGDGERRRLYVFFSRFLSASHIAINYNSISNLYIKLTDWVEVVGHFREFLLSRSLSLVLKKQNPKQLTRAT